MVIKAVKDSKLYNLIAYDELHYHHHLICQWRLAMETEEELA
jgi:hypothetical protein